MGEGDVPSASAATDKSLGNNSPSTLVPSLYDDQEWVNKKPYPEPWILILRRLRRPMTSTGNEWRSGGMRGIIHRTILAWYEVVDVELVFTLSVTFRPAFWYGGDLAVCYEYWVKGWPSNLSELFHSIIIQG